MDGSTAGALLVFFLIAALAGWAWLLNRNAVVGMLALVSFLLLAILAVMVLTVGGSALFSLGR